MENVVSCHIGECIVKGLVVTTVVKELTEVKDKVLVKTLKTVKQIVRTGLVTIQMGVFTLQELNIKWHKEMKLGMNKAYRSLCGNPKVEGELLFGDDLHNRIKSFMEVQKLTIHVGQGFNYRSTCRLYHHFYGQHANGQKSFKSNTSLFLGQSLHQYQPYHYNGGQDASFKGKSNQPHQKF